MENSYNIKLYTDQYIKLRREFHKIPEIGYKEFKTKLLILNSLRGLKGFDDHAKLREIGDTGMTIDIFGLKKVEMSCDKYMISIRADMDGLPFKEEADLSYKSEHEGMIHGCGHDGHITTLIATIDYYLCNLEKIPDNFGVRFLFQPAEEGIRGAIQMIEGGCLDGISEIYGLHNVTTFNLGEIGVIPGTIMAQIHIFDIIMKGHGGHSSTPHKCCSPINTGVQIITAINQISSQEIDSKERHAIGIGCFKSGEASNVIPDSGVIKGTIRSVSNETGDKIANRIVQISDSIGKLNSCEVTTRIHSPGNCTVNHIEQTAIVEKIAKKYFKLETHDLPLMASEDFSYYLEKTPGCFFMLGVGDENHKEYLHTPKYDFNDKGLPFGVEMFIRIIEEKASVSLI